MAKILVVVADLMLSSRVVESTKASGHEVTSLSHLPDAAPEGTSLTICDLDAVDAVAAVALGTPTLGFYSHTDVDTRERALSAGFDLVVPRSRMVRELPDLVQGLIKD
jgi:hypothetical protein